MKIPSILILTASISAVKAVLPTPRYNGGKSRNTRIIYFIQLFMQCIIIGCTTIGSQLFCYGGTVNRETTADHFVLDLTNDLNVGKSIDAWKSIVPVDGFELESNSLFSIVPLNDSYLIHGGLGYGNSSRYIKNTTTIYNTVRNSWTSVNAKNQSLMTPRYYYIYVRK